MNLPFVSADAVTFCCQPELAKARRPTRKMDFEKLAELDSALLSERGELGSPMFKYATSGFRAEADSLRHVALRCVLVMHKLFATE
jgi:hypothetical protein